MANIIKYTTQNLSATLAGLATGNHATSYTFGFTDAGLKWGGDNAPQYKTGTALTYSAKLPTYLTPSTKGGSVSSNTYTLNAYASFSSTGLKSNTASQTVELRQHAIPVLGSLSKAYLWVGESAEITYTFTYTPFSTDTKYSSANSTGSVSGTQANAKYTVTATGLSTATVKYGTATVKATAQDPVKTASANSTVKICAPITQLVFDVNKAYYLSAASAAEPLNTISVMAGATLEVYCYYNACYMANQVGNYGVSAYNAYLQGVTIKGKVGQVFAYSTGETSVSALTNPTSETYTTNMQLSTGTVHDSKIKLVNIGLGNAGAPIDIKMQTTSGAATGETGFGKPNSKDSIVNFIRIVTVSNFKVTLSLPTINPGDKTTVTFSGGVGTAKSVALVNAANDSASAITTFAAGAGKSLANGTFEATIPSTVAAGTYYIKVTPDNGKAQYQQITVKHVTLTLS